MRGPAVEVPSVERLLVGAGVEEDTRARLVDVEGDRGLGADGFVLFVKLEEAVGEKQSTIIVLCFCDVRSTTTPSTAPSTSITSNTVASSALVATAAAAVTTTTARLAAVARPVAAITTVEAGVVVYPAIVATASVSTAISLPALLLAAAWTTSRFLA